MVEKILENVVNEMAPHLSQDQLAESCSFLYKEGKDSCFLPGAGKRQPRSHKYW